MKKALLPLSLTALLLFGCSSEEGTIDPSNDSTSSPSDTVEDSPIAIPHGSFTFESPDGAVGTLEVPGPAPTAIEELRTLADAPPVTYITGNIDNRTGVELFVISEINVYDIDGNEYTYLPASEYLSEIRPSDAPAEIYNRYIDLGNSLMIDVDPLERADFVMVGPTLPDEIAGLYVTAGWEDLPVFPSSG